MIVARRIVASLVLVSALLTPGLRAGEVASGTLNIVGLSLETQESVTTGIDIPAVIQTTFGGKTNGDVPANGLIVAGELTGPGLDAPIPVTTKPGQKLTLPPLHEQGDYTVQNLRLVDSSGRFLQSAAPTFTVVHVVGVLGTQVTVKQLSPDDLRARGISIDSRNYDVYDYNFIFAINGQTVEVPYPVVVDRRTHQVVTLPGTPSYQLPVPQPAGPPPRFEPPSIASVVLTDDDLTGDASPTQGDQDESDPHRPHPSIPAAVVIPTGFGVLHQFFAVILNVSNNATDGSQIVLDSVTASITTPTGLSVVKVNPAVTIGQPVPIHGPNGETFLVAQMQGSADWSLEALRTGTHTVTVDVRATYKAPSQADVALHGQVSSSIVVSDPRFQINFVHPDNVRATEPYTAYAFITNTSPQAQTVRIDLSSIPACGSGYNNHLCRTEGGSGTLDQTFQPGQTVPVPYKLTPDITGHVYAAAGDAPDGISTSVSLVMGVSASGVPLSPATLLLPYYAQFVSPALVDAQMPFFGLGYSLATAPVIPQLATFPPVIKSDVFTRADDIARAGERIFAARQALATDSAAEDREPIFHLALDLLGNVERLDRIANTADMHEWDQLRMMESDARKGGAAMARELERVGLPSGKTMTQFVDDFAVAASHRSGFVLALAHGAPVSGNSRPYAMTVSGAISHTAMSIPAELPGATRTLPYGELTQFTSTTESGELALVGRWTENLQLSIVPAAASFTLDLLYPGDADGAFLRSSIAISGATPGSPVTITVARGNRTLNVAGATATPTVSDVAQTPLAVSGAAQDLHLDAGGHIVTVVFNRPVTVADATKLRDLFALTTSIPSASFSVVRKNNPADSAAPVVIPGAAQQDDGRMINISFDHALSTHASYSIALDPIADAVVAGRTFSSTAIVPRIDNDQPGGIVLGKLLLGDGSPIANGIVQLTSNDAMQWDVSLPDGTFLFEFVPRNIDLGIAGNYDLDNVNGDREAKLSGVIRTNGEVQRVVLQYLGRGSARGQARYSDGTPVANAPVTVGNQIYGDFHRAITDAAGNYTVGDLPVGPLTFAVQDSQGNVAYAANQVRTPGEVVQQDLVIEKRELAGLGTVRVTVRRSDKVDGSGSNLVVQGAHVGVYTQGYGLVDAYTDANGQFVFTKVPAGFISVLASEFSITRESAGVDLDLAPDTTIDQTLVLHVPTANDLSQQATIEGDVKRDDPTSPNDRTRDVLVPNAVVQISGLSSVSADASGHYIITNVPVSFAGRKVTAFDPSTNRGATVNLPSELAAGQSNPLPILLRSTTAQGFAKLRVRLFSASGAKVTNYHVIWPGYPPNVFDSDGDGYVLDNVKVPVSADIWAVPVGRDHLYGDQVAHGTIRADFDGQNPVLDLRLPGQGTVKARILVRERCPDSNPTCTPGNGVAAGRIGVSYLMWNDAEQAMTLQQRPPIDTDPVTGFAPINNVPVGSASVETIDHPSGYASQETFIAFEGDTKSLDLQLASMGNVTGRLVNYDGRSAVAGATLTFEGSVVHVDGVMTKADGSFVIPAMAGSQSFRITATATVDGIVRMGYVDGNTPAGGGPVNGLVIVMRQQANIDGRIVDRNNAPIAQARYWARELAWPNRSFGSPESPLIAGNDGRFFLNNVFSGDVRITAESPTFQEQRGDAQVQIGFEADDKSGVTITVGDDGTSSISVTVLDSDNGYAKVPNAEVTLTTNEGAFDFGSTDANGVVVFDQLPAGRTYAVRATSKVVGRSGSVDGIVLTRDVPATAQISLNLNGRVSGTLVDGDFEPKPAVAGAPVYLYSSALNTVTSSGGAGEFLFNGVPEGNFTLEGVDVNSGRKAKNTTPLFIDRLFPDRDGIQLELEKTGTLTVGVYLPDDHGASSGSFAPMAYVKVTAGLYSRELLAQGAAITFPKMLTGQRFAIDVKELGGLDRTAHYEGTFASGSYTADAAIVLATTGSVRIHVTADDPALVPNAQVTVNAPGRTSTLYTDATGIVQLDSVSLGNVSVQVLSQNLSGSASGMLESHAVLLELNVRLGSLASVDGFVDAEAGGVSTSTRVVADITSSSAAALHLETRTDANGHYLFNGVPVGSTHVTLSFYGPDDITIGATLDNVGIPDGTHGTVTMPRVRIDATPPSVVALFPANNANSVSPNTPLYITFSEPLSAASVIPGYFSLVATDDGSRVPVSVHSEIVNGAWRVDVQPLALLKSNVIYRFTIDTGVTDVTGNHLRLAVAESFTTVNYTEPKITAITPSTALPLDDGATFRLKFNKPIDLTSYDAGNGGVARLEQLDGPAGAVIATIPVTRYLDNLDASTLVIAPTGVAIQPSSYYRVTVSGTRDTQQPPNVQSAPQIYEYSSIDHVKPVVTILSPVGTGIPLIAGGVYTIKVSVADLGTNAPSKDIQYVDWFSNDGTSETALERVRTAPDYPHILHVPANATSVTLEASATDLSFNTSDVVSYTWTITPNLAPQNVTLTPSVAGAYRTRHVDAAVTFTDEGTLATVSLTATGTHADGSDYPLPAGAIHPSVNQQAIRPDTASPWSPSPVTFGIDLPADIQEGAPLHLVATVKDSDQQATTKSVDVNVLVDTNAPVVVSLAPAAETHYKYVTGADNTFPITLKVKDDESGVARVHIDYDGRSVDLTSGSYDAATATWTFTTTGQIAAKNGDTRIHLVATAYDNHGNATPAAADLVFESVNDGTFPVAQWLSPLDGAALPASQPVTLMLRLHATDDVHVESVIFNSPSFTTQPAVLTAPTRSGDLYEESVTFTMPAEGTPVTITATVNDSDPTHSVVIPITIDPVTVDTGAGDAVFLGDAAIQSSNAAQYANRTVVVSGASTHLYIKTPITLKNLLVLNGAQVGNPDRVKLDVTVKDHLYVDGDSSVDVSAKGYLGGYRTSEDLTFTNNDAHGMTAGGTTTGGAYNASASHGGLGSQGNEDSTANATYDSIQSPSDFGAGGSGQPNGSQAGGNGGGAVILHGGNATGDLGQLVIAGAIHADGQTGLGTFGAGAGGSVAITTQRLITGPSSRITAVGGDDEGADLNARGAGGGRIAVSATTRFDVSSEATLLQARGGRNAGGEGPNYLEGGAGTVFLQRPGSTLGELIVSAFDERNPTTTHRTYATPISTANGTLSFDGVTVSTRALARFDNDYAVADPAHVHVDSSALLLLPTDVPTVSMSTAPVAGSDVIQGASVQTSVDATSKAGVGAIRFAFSAGTPAATYLSDYPSPVAAAIANITVAPTTAPGAATLKAVVTDRAGRSAESAISSFNVIANVVPVITRFDVTPTSLQTYAGHTISVDAAATDDLAVTSLTLDAPGFSVNAQSPVANDGATTRAFAVTIPPNATSGTNVDLTLSVADGFPGHASQTQTKHVAILHDPNPPLVSVSSPQSGQTFLVSSTVTIPVRALIADAEVGVNPAAVFVALGDGTPVAMVNDPSTPNGFKADLPVPSVQGAAPVTKSLVITASDFEGNVAHSSALSISIQPVVDPDGPIVSWSCPTIGAGAMFPSGSSANVRVAVVPSNSDNGITSVNFYVGDSETAVPATLTNGLYAATLTLPVVTADTQVALRVVAISIRGNVTSSTNAVTVVSGGMQVTANRSVIAGDTSLDGQTVIVSGNAVLTIDGVHTFGRLIVLDNAVVTHSFVDGSFGTLDLTVTGATYVGCDAAIDVTGRGLTGYTNGVAPTWDPATHAPSFTSGAISFTAGSHGGSGGYWDTVVTAPYGSLYDPNEPGAAGNISRGGSCVTNCGNGGGGIVRLKAATIGIDGVVRANGAGTDSAAAGGSIRLDASTISGGGSIHADGGADTQGASGGGGRVALYYQTLGLPSANVAAASAAATSSRPYAFGAPGTVYLRQLDAGGGIVREELIVDNGGLTPGLSTPIVTAGTGTVTSVSGNSVTLSGTVPYDVDSSWIELLDANGTVVSTYRIATRTSDHVLALVPDTSSPAVSVGSNYRGVARFDKITARGGAIIDASNVSSSLLGGSNALLHFGELHTASALTFDHVLVRVDGPVTAQSLALTNGSTLTHGVTSTTNSHELDVSVPGALTIDATSSIDVSGDGYPGGSTDPGATTPGVRSGGSHLGVGGVFSTPGGSTYGSVERPLEPGAGGEDVDSGSAGGGVLRIAATNIEVAGAIRANGFLNKGGGRGGAGGSIWITTGKISGAGTVEANGGAEYYSDGGGGAIALQYTDGTSVLPTIQSTTGIPDGSSQLGGPGSIFVKGPLSVFGDLLVDDRGRHGRKTELPALGSGVAGSGSTGATLVTDRTEDIPLYFLGHWVEVTDAANNPKGTWRIAAIQNRTITLTPNGSESIGIVPGDRWEGVYRFDNLTVHGATLATGDGLRVTNPVVVDDGGQVISTAQAVAPTVALALNPAGPNIYPGNGLEADVTFDDAGIAVTVQVDIQGTQSDGSSYHDLSSQPLSRDDVSTPWALSSATFNLPLTLKAGTSLVVTATVSNAHNLSSTATATLAVVSDTPPQITRFDVTPSGSQTYANRTFTIDAAAVDDLGVYDLSLASSVGTLSSDDPQQSGGHGLSRHFTVIIPPATAAGTSIDLMLTATDSSGTLSTQTKSITVLKDATPPVVDVSLPVTNSTLEGGSVFTVEATIVEAETGVKRAWVSLAGHEYDLAADPARPGIWTASVPVPNSSGAVTLTVSAIDWEPTNVPAVVTIPLQLSAATRVDITAAETDSTFKARTLARSGTTLVVADRVAGGSDRIALFDITNAEAPQFVRSIVAGVGGIVDVKIHRGHALVLSQNQLAVVSLPDGTMTTMPLSAPGTAVAGAGNYVVVATGADLTLYDLATLTQVSSANAYRAIVTDLVPVDDDTVYAIAPDDGYAYYVGRGVMPIRNISQGGLDVNSPVQSPNNGFHPLRGRMQNGLLYVVGRSGMAVFNFAARPTSDIVTQVDGPGTGHGIDAFQSLTVTANDTAGAALFSGVPPGQVTPAGVVHADGSAVWDVLVDQPVIYLADEAGFTIVRHMPPSIDLSRVSFRSDAAAGLAIVAGTAGAVGGAQPVTVSISYDGTHWTDATASADGSFSVTTTVAANDVLTLTVSSAGNRIGPFVVGTVPDGRFFPVDDSVVDASFRATQLRLEGATLAVSSDPTVSRSTYGSDGLQHFPPSILLFDVTDPTTPVYRTALTPPSDHVNDVLTVGDVVYTGPSYSTGGLVVLDAHSGATLFEEPRQAEYPPSLVSMTKTGDYLFVAYKASYYVGNPFSYLRVWDVHTPSSPRLISSKFLSIYTARQVLRYGEAIVVIGAQGLLIFDANDFDAAQPLASLTAGTPLGQGGIVGTTLYLIDPINTQQLLTVDLTDPAHPQLTAPIAMSAAPATLNVRGGTGFITTADGHLLTGDLSTSAFTTTATRALTGQIGDVAIGSEVAYATNGDGIIVVPVVADPVLDPSRIAVTRSSGGAGVAGTAFAIRGEAPLTIALRNEITGTVVSAIPVGTDGSFSSTITGDSANSISATITDGRGHTTSSLVIGAVPIGDATLRVDLPGETSQLARQLLSNGATTIVLDRSTNVALYDTVNPATPHLLSSVPASSGVIESSTLSSGMLFTASGSNVTTMHLSDPTSLSSAYMQVDQVKAMAATTGALFIAAAHSSTTNAPAGTIAVGTIDDSQSIAYANNFDLVQGVAFTQLLPYGSDYLIAITPDTPSGADHDVVVINRHDPSNLTVVAERAIPGFAAVDGAISGTLLYVAGRTGGLAIVDLANPLAPTLRGTAASHGGVAHGVAVSGNRVAIGAAGAGVSLFDVTDPANPHYLGTEPGTENAYGVAFVQGSLYVAQDATFSVHHAVTDAPPPVVEVSAVTLIAMGDTTVGVTGTHGAVVGSAPLSGLITDTNSGASVTVSIAADGGFSTQLAANGGDTISLTPTDGRGRTGASVVVGTVPMFVPSLDLTRVVLLSNGVDRAVVQGAAGAASAAAPIVITIRNATRSTASSATAAADGSFSGDILAGNGDDITIEFVDGRNRMVGPFDLGTTPWAMNQHRITLPSVNGEPLIPTYLYKGSGALLASTQSNSGQGPMALFDLTNPDAPTFVRTIGEAEGNDTAALSHGYAYISPYNTYGFRAVPLADANAAPFTVASPSGLDINYMAVVGNQLFAAVGGVPGTIEHYDLTDPAHPLYAGSDGTLVPDDNVNALLPFGSDKLLVFTGGQQGAPAILVVDAHDPAHLTILSRYAPGANFWTGTVVGSVLYASDGGTISRIDLTNPTSPQLLATLGEPTSGYLRSSSTLVGVPQWDTGVALIDSSRTGLPVVAGRQPDPQTINDIEFGGSSLYIADASGLLVVTRSASIPVTARVTPSRVSVVATDASTAVVTGSAGAVTGVPPISVVVLNEGTGVAVPAVIAGADGTFSVTFPAQAWNGLRVTATDANGSVDSQEIASVPQYIGPPPVVDEAKIGLQATSATDVTVTGIAGAITGSEPPFRVYVSDEATGGSNLTYVADDGSFAFSIPANSGDAVTLTVYDNYDQVTGPISLASVPPFTAAPQVDTGRIALTAQNATTAVLTGSAGAVIGSGAITIVPHNVTQSLDGPSVIVGVDGSFVAQIPAVAGDSISIRAVDANGETTVALPGTVPSSSSLRLDPRSTRTTSAKRRARALTSDSTALTGSDRFFSRERTFALAPSITGDVELDKVGAHRHWPAGHADACDAGPLLDEEAFLCRPISAVLHLAVLSGQNAVHAGITTNRNRP